MSIRHINAALHLRMADPPCKAVLIGLANHADPITDECFPSIDLLILYSGLSERAIRDALRRLEQAGYVKTRVRPGTSSIYTLALPEPAFETTKKGRRPRQLAPLPRQEMPDTPAAGAPEPLKNPKEPSTRARAHEEARYSKPGQAVPDNWKPSDQLMHWCEERYPNVDIMSQVEPFIRINRAKDAKISNIEEAFKGFMTRVPSLRTPPPSRGGGGAAAPAPSRSEWQRRAVIEQQELEAEVARTRASWAVDPADVPAENRAARQAGMLTRWRPDGTAYIPAAGEPDPALEGE